MLDWDSLCCDGSNNRANKCFTRDEPVYLVRAQLQQQTVKAYGHDMPLQVGMTLEGDIMHETRKLYEWVLEPLFSITGKL